MDPLSCQLTRAIHAFFCNKHKRPRNRFLSSRLKSAPKWTFRATGPRSLSDAEVSFLQKGLNFAETPTNIPATDIVANVESAIRQLDTGQADTVRRSVKSILQKAKPPTGKPNITKDRQQAPQKFERG